MQPDRSCRIGKFRSAGPLGSATSRHIGDLSGPDEAQSDLIVDGATYYFHVTNGKKYPDETGKVFSSDQAAVTHAAVLAAELARDEDWDGFMISVTDVEGRSIAKIPVHT